MSLANLTFLRYATVIASLQSEATGTAPNPARYRTRTASETIFGCTFTVVFCLCYCTRPNMCAPYTSSARLLFRRIQIAFWTLMFPELIIGWAIRQWIEANRFARQYQARGWTTTHGYFALMGGFVLFQNGRPIQVLSPSMFTMLLRIGCIKFPSITTQDLQEKSNIHPILTAIILLQILWFTVQCIVRGTQGLAITPLEMMTLALVVMNAFLVIAWWHKPLDAREFVPLDLTDIPRPLNLDSHWPTTVDRDFSREGKLLGAQFKIVARLELPMDRVDNRFARLFKKVFMGPLYLFYGLLNDYGELRTPAESARIRDGDTEVPVFYSQEMSEPAVAFLFCATNILGSLFAAVHACLWFYDFPSRRDMMVWRIATVLSATVPMFFFVATVLLIFAVIISLLLSNQLSSVVIQSTQIFATVVVTIGFIIGTAARMALVVEAFLCLEGSAMIYVQWTDYIPHIS